MTVAEIIGNQYMRILALEETVGRLQDENSGLKEKILVLTPKPAAEKKEPEKKEEG